MVYNTRDNSSIEDFPLSMCSLSRITAKIWFQQQCSISGSSLTFFCAQLGIISEETRSMKNVSVEVFRGRQRTITIHCKLIIVFSIERRLLPRTRNAFFLIQDANHISRLKALNRQIQRVNNDNKQ